MPFTVEITDVKLADRQLTVDVLYADSDTNWNKRDVFDFQNADTIVFTDIAIAIKAKARIYKDAIANEANLKTKIGTKYTI
jgi:hypothetical protein